MIAMMMMPIAMISAAMVQPASAQTPASVIADSVVGWNTGDLDRFMAPYAEDAIYVTEKGVVRGKPTIATHYAPSFSGGTNKRGMLTIEPLVERTLDARHRLMVGRWTLRGAAMQTGLTTLLFELRGSDWRIISDHSS